MPVAHIGIDDTDSNELGMCTTYIGAVLDERLRALGFASAGEPRLVRLNPANPTKTRGNGAVHLRYHVRGREELPMILKEAEDVVARLAALGDPKADPGIVAIQSDGRPPEALSGFYWSALRGIVSIGQALDLIVRLGGVASWFKEGRGVIGALAAIGAPEEETRMYELLAYRPPIPLKGPRAVDEESVRLADLETWPLTYDNYDWYYMEALVAPHGPDPVLLGIRGPDRSSLFRAYDLIRVEDRVERVALYRTNHGSGSHVVDVGGVRDLRPYTTVRLEGRVSARPWVGPGSHAFFELEDAYGDRIRVAAYEPTKHFRRIVLSLEPGDRVRVVGSYRPRPPEPPTINLESMEVLDLVSVYRRAAPTCPRCGHRMESAGLGKGYRCPACGYADAGLEPTRVRVPRRLVRGQFTPPPRAHRHLTRPPEAYLWERRPACGVED